MNTKNIKEKLAPKKNQPTTTIKDENNKTIEVDFFSVLMNLDELTGNKNNN